MLTSSLLRLLPIALLGLQPAVAVEAVKQDAEQAEAQGSTGDGQSPNLAVKVSTSFPAAEIFGVKLVNGRATDAVVSVTNEEPTAINVRFIGGSLWTAPAPGLPSTVLRNLSTTVFDGSIPAGESESFTYKITTNMHPADVRLNIAAILVDEKQQFYTISAFNETVSVVEAPTSIFDPQIIFLYLIIAAVLGGTAFFVYSTWISTLFPQKKRGGKGGERAKANSRQTKAVDPSDQIGVTGGDGPAVTSGAKAYDESWIPLDHLKRPEAKRIRSGTPSGVRTKKAA